VGCLGLGWATGGVCSKGVWRQQDAASPAGKVWVCLACGEGLPRLRGRSASPAGKVCLACGEGLPRLRGRSASPAGTVCCSLRGRLQAAASRAAARGCCHGCDKAGTARAGCCMRVSRHAGQLTRARALVTRLPGPRRGKAATVLEWLTCRCSCARPHARVRAAQVLRAWMHGALCSLRRARLRPGRATRRLQESESWINRNPSPSP
jgi:hypothetical protein